MRTSRGGSNTGGDQAGVGVSRGGSETGGDQAGVGVSRGGSRWQEAS